MTHVCWNCHKEIENKKGVHMHIIREYCYHPGCSERQHDITLCEKCYNDWEHG